MAASPEAIAEKVKHAPSYRIAVATVFQSDLPQSQKFNLLLDAARADGRALTPLTVTYAWLQSEGIQSEEIMKQLDLTKGKLRNALQSGEAIDCPNVAVLAKQKPGLAEALRALPEEPQGKVAKKASKKAKKTKTKPEAKVASPPKKLKKQAPKSAPKQRQPRSEEKQAKPQAIGFTPDAVVTLLRAASDPELFAKLQDVLSVFAAVGYKSIDEVLGVLKVVVPTAK